VQDGEQLNAATGSTEGKGVEG